MKIKIKYEKNTNGVMATSSCTKRVYIAKMLILLK